MKDFEINLGYYKKGDDMAHCLEHFKDDEDRDAKALIAHAEMLEDSAQTLRKLSSYAKEGQLKIVDANVHFIWVDIDQKLGEQLENEGLLWSMERDWEEDEDWEDWEKDNESEETD